MTSRFAQVLEQARGTHQRCIVGRYLEALPEDDRVTLQQMMDVASGYRVYHLLLTVDGIDEDTIPSSHAFRIHKAGRCRCRP